VIFFEKKARDSANPLRGKEDFTYKKALNSRKGNG
jgi:hypothetical protein